MLQVLEKGLVKERSSLSEAVIETGNGVLREGGAVTEKVEDVGPIDAGAAPRVKPSSNSGTGRSA